jgi:hypothetical protein
MFRKLGFASFYLGCLACLSVVNSANAQVRSGLITQNIDEGKRVTLRGNIRREATPDNDRGLVDDDFSMQHMLLQLRRSSNQEHALQEFIDDLQNPTSPTFHRWISPK